MNESPHPIHRLPAPARVGVLVFFAAGLADGALAPFLALWAVREAGVPVAAVGVLLGLYAGGELLATPLVGGLSDRLGRRPVLIASTLGVGLGLLALSRVHGTAAAAAVLLAVGACESVLHPTAAAVVADVVPGPDLRRAYGLTRAAAGLGAVLGPALGALLVAHALSAVFAAAALALLAACLAVALGLRETRAAPAEGDDDAAALAAAFRDPRLAALLAPLAGIEIAASWIEAVLPLAATQEGALSPAGVGWLFAYAGLLGAALQMPVLRLCRGAAGSRLVLAAGGLLALAFAALALAPGLAGPVLAVSGLAVSGLLVGPLVHAVALEMAPAPARATYAAALSAVQDLKDAAGPALGTALFALAPALPWLVGLPLALAAAGGLAAALRGREAAETGRTPAG